MTPPYRTPTDVPRDPPAPWRPSEDVTGLAVMSGLSSYAVLLICAYSYVEFGRRGALVVAIGVSPVTLCASIVFAIAVIRGIRP